MKKNARLVQYLRTIGFILLIATSIYWNKSYGNEGREGEQLSQAVYQKSKSDQRLLKFLTINGSFDEKGKAVLSPLYIIDSNRYDSPSGIGPYLIELLDKDNIIIKSYNFSTETMRITLDSGPEREVDSRMFSFNIPFDERINKVVIRKGEKILYRVSRSANAPIVQFKNPQEGEVVRGIINIEWSGFDADGDILAYQLEYSEDGGISWEPFTGFITEVNIEKDVKQFKSSKDATLRIVCTDGLNTASNSVKIIVNNPVHIQYTVPFNNENNVGSTPTLYVKFTNAIKSEFINENSFLLFENGTEKVLGEVAYNSYSQSATFIPNNRLKNNISYTAKIAAGIEDFTGNALMSDYEFKFFVSDSYFDEDPDLND